jgi:preprotein translocase subunit SecE
MTGIINFFTEVRSELNKVTWPTREEIFQMTGIVIITTVIVSAYVGVIDLGLTKLIEVFLN